MPAERKPAAPVVEPDPVDLGLGAEDVELPRLSVVSKQGKLFDAGIAQPGNIAIGNGAKDDETAVYDTMNGAHKLRIYVLNIHPNYACSWKDKEANPDLAGTWEEGDADMPPEAKRQYNYILFIPEHSALLPVKYTASSSAAGECRRTVNSKLGREALVGKQPYETCFEMFTKMNTGKYTWPGPAFALGEPDADELVAAQQMHDAMFGPARQAITAGDKPAL